MTPRVAAAMWRFGMAEAVAYRASMFVWILATCFPLVSLALWSHLAEDGSIGGYDQRGFVSYFVAAFMVRQVTSAWVCWDLTRHIRLGELDAMLLRPAHPILHYVMSNFAALPMRTLMALPLGVGVLVLAGGGAPVTAGDALRALPTLVFAWGIVFLCQLAVASLAFWLTSATSLYEAWLALHLVLSGYLLPTSLFPERFAEVIRALPFHAALGFPVEVLTGRLSQAAFLEGLGLQCFWVASFGVLASICWRRGLARYGSVGA
jgi:ABC-2 type transport system permease protein